MQLETRETHTERMAADSGVNYQEQLVKKSFWLNVEFFVAFGSAFLWLYLQVSVLGFNLLLSLIGGYCIMLAIRFCIDAQASVNFFKHSGTFFSNIMLLGLVSYFDQSLSPSPMVAWALCLSVMWARDWSISHTYKGFGQKFIGVFYGFLLVVFMISTKLLVLVGESYFFLAFAAAIYVALICEYIFELVTVYKVEFTAKRGWLLTLLSLFFAVLCLGFVFVLVNIAGLSVLVAGVASVIAVKILQPWTLQWFFR